MLKWVGLVFFQEARGNKLQCFSEIPFLLRNMNLDGMVEFLLSILCDYDNLVLKLHQKNPAATVTKDDFLLAD